MHYNRHRLTAVVAYVTTLTYASTNDQRDRPACPLASSSKTKPCQFSSVRAFGRNHSASASDSAYYDIFLSSVVWLSSVCRTGAPCLNRSTDLDAICQVHLQWHVVLHMGSVTPRKLENLGSNSGQNSENVSPMLPFGEYKREVGWTVIPPFIRLFCSLLLLLLLLLLLNFDIVAVCSSTGSKLLIIYSAPDNERSVADWSGGMSACCTKIQPVRALNNRNVVLRLVLGRANQLHLPESSRLCTNHLNG